MHDDPVNLTGDLRGRAVASTRSVFELALSQESRSRGPAPNTRLVLVDHKTDTATPVTVSAAVVGADHVDMQIGAGRILTEAEAAVLRAKTNGGNRLERVPLAPSRDR